MRGRRRQPSVRCSWPFAPSLRKRTTNRDSGSAAGTCVMTVPPHLPTAMEGTHRMRSCGLSFLDRAAGGLPVASGCLLPRPALLRGDPALADDQLRLLEGLPGQPGHALQRVVVRGRHRGSLSRATRGALAAAREAGCARPPAANRWVLSGPRLWPMGDQAERLQAARGFAAPGARADRHVRLAEVRNASGEGRSGRAVAGSLNPLAKAERLCRCDLEHDRRRSVCS
jgi:hypothetical protein